MTENKENKKSFKLIIPITLGILVAFIIALLLNKCDGPKEVKKPLPLDADQGEYVEPERKTDHSKNISMPGWGEIHIPANTIDIDKGIDFYNPEANLWYKCPDCGSELDENFKCMNEECGHQFEKDKVEQDLYYLMFTLCLEKDDEQLYQSGLVSPGMHIQHIQIAHELPVGEYDAHVKIEPYKSDKVTECNKGNVKIKLIVQ